MSETQPHRKGPAGSEAGLTLLEVLVAMTVFIVVTGSIFGLLQVAQISRTSVTNNVQLTKSLRLGLNLIGRDTYNAGLGYPFDENRVILRDNRASLLLGVPVDVDTNVDNVPPIIAGNNITLNTFNTTPNTHTDQVTLMFKDVAFNLVGTAPRQVSQTINVTSMTSGSGVDELNLPSGGGAKCQVNDIFLVQGDTSYTLGMVTAISGNRLSFASGDVLGLNNPVAGGEMRSITPKAIIRIKVITYFVTADGTLTRREFGNIAPPGMPGVGYVDEPLVYGVEDFQIKYVLDDGTLVDNPSAGPDGIAGTADDDQSNLANVRQVRFTISAKTTEWDSNGAPVKASQTATFATRNLGYDAN